MKIWWYQQTAVDETSVTLLFWLKRFIQPFNCHSTLQRHLKYVTISNYFKYKKELQNPTGPAKIDTLIES